MDRCMRRCLDGELGPSTGLSSLESSPDTARTSSHVQPFGGLIPHPDPQRPQALLGLSPDRGAARGGDEQGQDLQDNPGEIPAYRTWLLWRLLWQRLPELLGTGSDRVRNAFGQHGWGHPSIPQAPSHLECRPRAPDQARQHQARPLQAHPLQAHPLQECQRRARQRRAHVLLMQRGSGMCPRGRLHSGNPTDLHSTRVSPLLLCANTPPPSLGQPVGTVEALVTVVTHRSPLLSLQPWLRPLLPGHPLWGHKGTWSGHC